MTRIWAALVGVGGFLAALGVVWWQAARNAAIRTKNDDLTGFKETIERASNADTSSGDSNDNIDWLRERGKR